MIQVALFLVAKGFAVADEKLKVARVRLIDVRIINFINDAMAQREPDTATGMIRCPYALFALEVQRGSIPGAPNATKSPEFIL
jgi:hypothetical protein